MSDERLQEPIPGSFIRDREGNVKPNLDDHAMRDRMMEDKPEVEKKGGKRNVRK